MQKTGTLILSLVLITLVTASCTGFDLTITDATPQPSGQPADIAYNTPEEAITAYLDGVAQNDVNKILAASAIDEMSEGFRFDLSAERLQLLDLGRSPSPSDYPFFAEINQLQTSSDILGGVKWLAYGLLSEENMEGGPIYPVDAQRVRNFIADVDPARLSAIEIKQISLPDEALMADARYLERAANLADIYGADDLTERVVLFGFEENSYVIGFSLLRYADNWKIKDQTSPLAGINPNGAPQQISEEAFEQLINGN